MRSTERMMGRPVRKTIVRPHGFGLQQGLATTNTTSAVGLRLSGEIGMLATLQSQRRPRPRIAAATHHPFR